jgi:hypothetical protein
MRKELLFGFSIMGLVVLATLAFMPWGNLESGHVGLLMLALVVVAIMLGFPTAFTLMGMGVIFTFFAYYFRDPNLALTNTLTLMVQRTYGTGASAGIAGRCDHLYLRNICNRHWHRGRCGNADGPIGPATDAEKRL